MTPENGDAPRTCETCRHGKRVANPADLKAEQLTCSRFPPVAQAFITQRGVMNASSWPLVNPAESCGEWGARA